MRSPIDARSFEWGARALLFATVLALLWRVWSPPPVAGNEAVTSDGLAGALQRWTTGPAPGRASLRIERLPSPAERDWLAAVVRAGSDVEWHGSLDAIAVEALASAEPQHSYVIRATGAPGSGLTVTDGAREIAAIEAREGAASVRTTVLSGPVSVNGRVGRASAARPRARRIGRVAVIGPAGWETKFVIAALEERGWNVESRVAVGPAVTVGTLRGATLDTSRYSAVVVVQQLAGGSAAELARFVRTGGGLIATGGAIRDRSLASLLPARPGRSLGARDSAVVTREALGGLTLAPGPRAAVLEARAEAPVVAAGRVGNGRVIVAGYSDTWQWRMRGDDSSLEAHRDWWSAVVGAAAYAPDTAESVHSPESAPLAAWHAALGPPGAAEPLLLRGRRLPVEALLFALAALALLSEIVSRRRRSLP
ncbi:MAG TPA: hypothetical protein VFZ56_05620 [Gemmatimonadaceae bacterium]